MKKSLPIYMLFIALSISSCDQEKINDPLNLNGITLDLKVNLTRSEFKIEDGIDVLSKELTDYIFIDNETPNEKINEFTFQKHNDKILINYPLEASRIAEPCETQTKKCYTQSCVEETFKEILGDGSRSVEIKYIRNRFNVEIEYTYLDC